MATNEELEKRIETLEKEVQHLKGILQYQMRNNKKWFIFCQDSWFKVVILQLFLKDFAYLIFTLNTKNKEMFFVEII